MARWMVALVVVAGCTQAPLIDGMWEPWRKPDARIQGGGTDPAWTQIVDDAAQKWIVPLVAMGCDAPFSGDHPTPVSLVPPDQWMIPDAVGVEGLQYIDILGTIDSITLTGAYETILPHEFGHALGLDHSIRAFSVMRTPNSATTPSDEDLQMAAHNLGCL